MIILVVNAGSSSLKYQLIDMKDESVIAKGNCDRIGIDGHLSHKTASGVKVEEDCAFPTHEEAFERLVQALTTGEGAVISSMSEISAVGHRGNRRDHREDRRAAGTGTGTQPWSRTGIVGMPQDSAGCSAGRCL